MDTKQLTDFALWLMAFIFSTCFHEAAHAWAAKRGGDLTAYEAGSLTMDPIPHIKRSPFGMVLVPIISFFLTGFMIGWASAPYDPHWARRHPHRAAWMALAGPAANLILVVISALVFRAMHSFGLVSGADVGSLMYILLHLIHIMYFLNVILCAFNLIPLPPLDGAQGILIFFKEKNADQVQNTLNSLGFFGLFIAWAIFSKIGGPLLNVTEQLLYLGF